MLLNNFFESFKEQFQIKEILKNVHVSVSAGVPINPVIIDSRHKAPHFHDIFGLKL